MFNRYIVLTILQTVKITSKAKPMTNTKLVYITTKNITEAKQIGGDLVREHLAACVNILPQMTSIYYWQGAVQTDEETVLIAKTTAALVTQLIQRVKALHSYDTPAILVLDVEAGNNAYLEWLEQSVKLNNN